MNLEDVAVHLLLMTLAGSLDSAVSQIRLEPRVIVLLDIVHSSLVAATFLVVWWMAVQILVVVIELVKVALFFERHTVVGTL